MKLTDYVIRFLADRGVTHAFGLTGGAVVHLFDSANRSGRITPIFHHHEQAAAFAAQACARANRRLAACFVTTGPGVTNAITGLAAAWLDSVPCIYISGQTRLAHTTRGKKIRQLGAQQLDVIPLVQSLTKYAVMVEHARSIRQELEKAVHLATTGRPGPVWLDLPLDLQWADIDPDSLPGFTPAAEPAVSSPTSQQIAECAALLAHSRRPLVLAGYGAVRAMAQRSFTDFVERFELPFVTTWGAVDLLPTHHPLNLGRPGIAGQRGANLAVQNCDLLFAIGSHLNIPVTGTMFPSFARKAKIVMVDIDPEELAERTIPVHLPIAADARVFLEQFLAATPAGPASPSDEWREACAGYKRHLVPPPAATGGPISPYDYVRTLSDLSAENDIVVVDGGGTNVYVSFQTFALKAGQRMILSTGLCSMGSGLPEAIGACYGSGLRRTLCLSGDGSMQLNIQELQTIAHHQLPIKIFISANGGYLSIRQTQKEFLGGNYVGSHADGGMSLPDYTRVAAAYGLPVVEIKDYAELQKGLREILALAGPAVCVVHTSPVQELNPRQGFDRRANGTFAPRPLEDMAPFLDREEFARLMISQLESQPACR
ncbi:MAG: thiamine pyrophosphate-binding protein [Opitutae bacterium]|nr:thiamine pyrophosphate-binding protein [Opitutae bacterium]